MLKIKNIFTLSIIFLTLWILLYVLDFFLNGNFWLWEYVLFIPEYFFVIIVFLLLLLSIKNNDKLTILVSSVLFLLTITNLPMIWKASNFEASDDTITILTYNKGYWQRVDNNFIEFLKEQNADIVFIQENLKEEKLIDLSNQMPEFYIVRGHDLVTISRFPIIKSEQAKGRFLKTTILVNDSKIELYNIHLALEFFSLRQKEYEELYGLLESNKNCKIIAGDFNTVSKSKSLERMIKSYNDAATIGISYPITWNSIIPMFRIDYIFSSKQLDPVNYSAFIHLPSDHYVVKATLANIKSCSW